MSEAPLSNFQTVVLASDHAGFARKAYVHARLTDAGYHVVDAGPHTYDPADDYPETIRPAVQSLGSGSCAIVFGKSGQGEAIVANRFRGIRAVVYPGGNEDVVRLARQHNDANVLAIGSEFVGDAEAWRAVELFLATPFSGDDRHVRRIQLIDA